MLQQREDVDILKVLGTLNWNVKTLGQKKSFSTHTRHFPVYKFIAEFGASTRSFPALLIEGVR